MQLLSQIIIQWIENIHLTNTLSLFLYLYSGSDLTTPSTTTTASNLALSEILERISRIVLVLSKQPTNDESTNKHGEMPLEEPITRTEADQNRSGDTANRFGQWPREQRFEHSDNLGSFEHGQ